MHLSRYWHRRLKSFLFSCNYEKKLYSFCKTQEQAGVSFTRLERYGKWFRVPYNSSKNIAFPISNANYLYREILKFLIAAKLFRVLPLRCEGNFVQEIDLIASKMLSVSLVSRKKKFQRILQDVWVSSGKAQCLHGVVVDGCGYN
ncbi:hypothetical protein P5673_016958 [Acropora cervicornis]|uniref:Uncharacterized protein n=1 Tax=Acropora cervicornis TaxID=6130 RepID=A0AAD9V454_ACRCE|nr:hypothetical protein P5673_016958 [Acropora cervicornis]